ncbi:MAG TPA: UDP-N-acetylmuramoyl-L-alanine--D-glutamate ligase, partial [Firmicutes bacterium]|nr:UDP-N-acetylmuramoyl-L-alanine--D-glutamate ligase [Bacillota bacterium]
MEDFSGKRVLVVGLARSGTAAAEVLARRGAHVVATDAKDEAALQQPVERLRRLGVELVLGAQPLELAAQTDLVVVSPGVPDGIPLLAEAERRHVPVVSEVELAARLYAGPYLAITGSNGKTTTTTWVGFTLKEAGVPAVVAGNIGVPVSHTVDNLAPGTWVVTEVSSFQLARTERFHPHVAAILNLSEDHLDRHGSFAAYRAAKAKVFANQEHEDYLVLNADDEATRSLASAAGARVLYFSRHQRLPEGAWVEEEQVVLGWQGREEVICPVEAVSLPGAHNLENALATALLARCAGAAP